MRSPAWVTCAILAAYFCVGSPVWAGTVSEYVFGNTQSVSPAPQLSLNGGAIQLNGTYTGWYNNAGDHLAATNFSSYITGSCSATDCGTAMLFHNFFVFDLSSVGTTITSATLNLFEPANGYNSPNASETYQIWDVSTPIPTLTGSQSGATAIWADLGSGASYGTGFVTAAESGSVIPFTLNASAIQALNAAEGGNFALGGSLGAAPEPAAALLILPGLAMLAWRKRAR